jgi:ubiquinol-cytochrome c reductase cytochrome c subunit
MKPAILSAAALVLALAAPAAHAAPAKPAPAKAAPAKPTPAAVQAGAKLYVSTGCYECHGYAGQGSIQTGGTRLAPDPISAARFRAYVRAPTGKMPPYSHAVMSDQQLDQIHDYLASMPPARGPQRIPMLNSLLAATGGDAPAVAATAEEQALGAKVYVASCQGCHGANGSGGFGGDVLGEAEKRTIGGTVRLVKEPPLGMPKLFPAPLSEADVQAVARYVHDLHK